MVSSGSSAAGHIVQGAVSLGVSDKGVYERGGVRDGGGGTDADGDAASDSHDAVRVEHDLVVLALDGALERGAVHGKGSGPAGTDGEQAVRRAVNIDVLRVRVFEPGVCLRSGAGLDGDDGGGQVQVGSAAFLSRVRAGAAARQSRQQRAEREDGE